MLEDMTAMRNLCIQHNNLGGTSFNSLAKALDAHEKLRYLDISFNKIGNAGF